MTTDSEPASPSIKSTYIARSLLRKIEASAQVALLCIYLLWPPPSQGSSVSVRYREGVSHGFLVLRTLDGKEIAYGEASQLTEGKDGDRVTNALRLRFNDGSYYDETTIFLQRDTFRLISDHVLQKGPSLRPNMETSITPRRIRPNDEGVRRQLLAGSLGSRLVVRACPVTNQPGVSAGRYSSAVWEWLYSGLCLRVGCY